MTEEEKQIYEVGKLVGYERGLIQGLKIACVVAAAEAIMFLFLQG
jgi:hypothetical protein